MTLADLKKEIARVEATASTGYVSDHKTWLQNRETEDAALRQMRCPTCGNDVTLFVGRVSETYTCKADRKHLFERFSSLIKPR